MLLCSHHTFFRKFHMICTSQPPKERDLFYYERPSIQTVSTAFDLPPFWIASKQIFFWNEKKNFLRTNSKQYCVYIYIQKKFLKIFTDINMRLAKAWPAINRLSVTWKSDLTDKIKRSFFQAAVVSILLYGSITWTPTKRMEKKLDGNYTRMLRATLNKSCRQHPTKQQLYGH